MIRHIGCGGNVPYDDTELGVIYEPCEKCGQDPTGAVEDYFPASESGMKPEFFDAYNALLAACQNYVEGQNDGRLGKRILVQMEQAIALHELAISGKRNLDSPDIRFSAFMKE